MIVNQVCGVARLHELIGGHLAEDVEPDQLAIGIETDRGPWVHALIATGYTIVAINPRQVPGIGSGTAPRVRS